MSGANQLLATFGLPPSLPFFAYGEAAADSTTRRVYVVSYYDVTNPLGYSSHHA